MQGRGTERHPHEQQGGQGGRNHAQEVTIHHPAAIGATQALVQGPLRSH
jgi:hypothetical protein